MHTSISISAYFELLIFSDMVGGGAMPILPGFTVQWVTQGGHVAVGTAWAQAQSSGE